MTLCFHDGNVFFTSANCELLREHWSGDLDAGFVYAGISSRGILKVGMSRRCPFCRMRQQCLDPRGVAFSRHVFEHEARIIRLLGNAVRGREWFTNPEPRLNFLFRTGLMNDLLVTELLLAREYG